MVLYTLKVGGNEFVCEEAHAQGQGFLHLCCKMEIWWSVWRGGLFGHQSCYIKPCTFIQTLIPLFFTYSILY